MNKEIALQILKGIAMSPNLLLSRGDHDNFANAIMFIESELNKEIKEPEQLKDDKTI